MKLVSKNELYISIKTVSWCFKITDPATFLSEFSCKVTYNGLTRFLWFQKVCMTGEFLLNYCL